MDSPDQSSRRNQNEQQRDNRTHGASADLPQRSDSMRTRRGVIAIITKNSKLLTIRRSGSVAAPFAVCFPGGGIEPGETEQEALVRELKEELGITVQPVRKLWENVTPWNVHLSWWLADWKEKEPIQINSSEVIAYQWLTLEDIKSLPDFLESNQPFVELALAGKIKLWD